MDGGIVVLFNIGLVCFVLPNENRETGAGAGTERWGVCDTAAVDWIVSVSKEREALFDVFETLAEEPDLLGVLGGVSKGGAIQIVRQYTKERLENKTY